MERHEIERRIFAGPQLEEGEIRRLPHEGFTTIIDLRREGATNVLIPPKEEAQIARDAGLGYVHIPIDWEHVDHHQAHELRRAIADARPSIYVHSRRGDMAAAMLLLDRAAKNDWDPKRAVHRAAEQGYIEERSAAADFMRRYLEQEHEEVHGA